MILDDFMPSVREWQKQDGLLPDVGNNVLDIHCGLKVARRFNFIEDIYGGMQDFKSGKSGWYTYLPDGRPIFMNWHRKSFLIIRPKSLVLRENELYLKIMYECDSYLAITRV